jgi:hypothetical protein
MRRRLPKRRRVTADVTQVVLDFKGPSDEVKIFWLRLWSYRSRLDQIRDLLQAELADLFGYTERTFRRLIAQAAQWGMLVHHRGFRSRESLYNLQYPRHWSAVRRTGSWALKPPRRRPALEPPALAVAPAVAANGSSGDETGTFPEGYFSFPPENADISR